MRQLRNTTKIKGLPNGRWQGVGTRLEIETTIKEEPAALLPSGFRKDETIGQYGLRDGDDGRTP